MITSDHDYLEIEIETEGLPYQTQPKEFYYSNQLNQPKEQDLHNYLEYILKYLELVMENQLTQESFDRIKRTFTDKTIVVRRNQANMVYEVEKKVQKMLEKRMPYEQI